MQAEYQNLWNRLEIAVKNREISAYEYSAIKAMCDKVASNVAEGSEILKKGVNEVMGGQLLDFEGRRIAINSAIETLLRRHVSTQEIIDDLIATYELSEKEASSAIENVKKLQLTSA